MFCPPPDFGSRIRQPYRLHPHYISTPETRSFLKANSRPHRTALCGHPDVYYSVPVERANAYLHNWRFLVGDIEVVETMVYVAASRAAVAEVE